MDICCLDLEGVLVPEIWIEVAKKTKIKELKITTREEPDYDKLMKRRIRILRENKILLADVQRVIAGMKPLPGAAAFLDKLREKFQVIILSDTYYEFAMPLMKKLGYPTLFCNSLEAGRDGYFSGYTLRQVNGKEKAVRALKSAGFRVVASGDSYNDLTMLKSADRGVFFNPPSSIAKDHPHFKVARNYAALLKALGA